MKKLLKYLDLDKCLQVTQSLLVRGFKYRIKKLYWTGPGENDEGYFCNAKNTILQNFLRL